MTTRKYFSIFLILLFILVSCKQKKKERSPEEKFFPVLSYLQSQVAQVDTSLYSIVRYDNTDSLHTDTSYIPREKFKEAAKDFLSIPDISSTELEDNYTEDKQFDESLNRVVMTYLPKNPEKEEIQRQEVLIKPDASGDKVMNIIINRVISNKDSLIEKKMLWRINESFQVTTIRQYTGQPEKTSTYKVSWNEDQ